MNHFGNPVNNLEDANHTPQAKPDIVLCNTKEPEAPQEQEFLGEATYSFEDNKLRFYADAWLDTEVYQEFKDRGFKWAPKQELFVCPRWTPAAEDLCLKYAPGIEPEQTTLMERAEAKAGRLDGLAGKRASDSSVFYKASRAIVEHIPLGQPIIVGHHSERRHRNTLNRSWALMGKSVRAAEKAEHWEYKSKGVLSNAVRKGRVETRLNRMSRLFAEMRKYQRNINHGYICLDLWKKIEAMSEPERTKKSKWFSGAMLEHGYAAPSGLWDKLRSDEITTDEAIRLCLRSAENGINHSGTKRVINHLLARLAYERAQLGEVQRYSGEVTKTILQAFCREHGAAKPSAKKQGEKWVIESEVPLPIHLSEGKSLELSSEEWKDLMMETGYEVPPPKPKKPPILNFRAEMIQFENAYHEGETYWYSQVEMTKAEYKAAYSTGVKLSACGGYRVKVCNVGPGLGNWACVFLTDSKQHPAPDSKSFTPAKTPEDTAGDSK